MTVMCILKFRGRCILTSEPMPRPEIGDRDTVVEVVKTQVGDCYQLERFGYENLYHSRGFATLPEQSADEMQDQEREAIINIEKAIV